MSLNASFFAAVFALTAAVCWGAGDFTGGLATRRPVPMRQSRWRLLILVAVLAIALITI